MNTQTLYLPVINDYKMSARAGNIFTHFINWCNLQEKDRLTWLGIILSAHGCIITPVTLFFVVASGVNPVLLSLTTVSIMVNLTVNLAAMPTKITIPVFFLSFLISVVVIAGSFGIGVNLSRIF